MKTIKPKFVEYVPGTLEEGVLYVSMEYRTAVHLCICGCGNKVVTPISPKFWKLTYDGAGISLYPSIGNWNFPCQSHYWIKDSLIDHAPRWREPQHTKKKVVNVELPEKDKSLVMQPPIDQPKAEQQEKKAQEHAQHNVSPIRRFFKSLFSL